MTTHWIDRSFGLIAKKANFHTLRQNEETTGQEKFGDSTCLEDLALPFFKEYNPLLKRVELCSRLDFETTGIISAQISSYLTSQPQILPAPLYKCYLLEVCGNLPIKGFFTINTQIKTANQKGNKVVVLPPLNLQNVKTPAAQNPNKKTVLISLKHNNQKSRTYLMAIISKGARHQIRAHMSHIGFPIVNDPLYGTKDEQGPMRLFSYALYTPTRGFFAVNSDVM